MRIKILLAALTIFLLFLGCGGGGSSNSSSSEKRALQVNLIDDFLDNAIVKDSNNQQAHYEGNGIYTFEKQPYGTITLQGGTFENTNIPNKMVMEIDASSNKLSPINSFFYKYPDLKKRVLLALNAKETDYTINKNIALFRTSKIVYIMASNELLEHFASSLKSVSSYNDIINVARNVSKLSSKSSLIDAYLATIALSFFDVNNFSNLPQITNNVELLISSTYPKDNDIDIPKNTQLNIIFNKNIKSSSVNNKLSLKEKGTNNDISIKTTIDKNIVSIKPNSILKDNTEYLLSIDASIQSEDNKALKNATSITFTTSYALDTIKPKLIESSVENQDELEYGDKISIEFSETIDKATLNDGIIITQIENTNKRNPINLNFSFSNNNKTITIDNFLDGNSFYNYELNITSKLKDLTGNSLENPKNVTFKIKTDKKDPKILSITPPNDAIGLGIDTKITITFDEPVNEYSATNNTKITREKDGKNVTFAKSFSADKTIMTITPANLTNNSKFLLTIQSDLEDTSGNQLGTTKTSYFTVGTLDENEPTIIQALGVDTSVGNFTPLNQAGKTFLANGEGIKIEFSEPIDSTSIENKDYVYVKDSGGNKIQINSNTCYTKNCTTNGYLDRTDQSTYVITINLNDGDYTLVVDKNVKDLSGNKLKNDYTQKFKVQNLITPALGFSLSMPLLSGAKDIPIDQPLDLNFSSETTINSNQITLTNMATSIAVPLNLSPNFGTKSQNFTLSPTSNLDNNTEYKLVISGSIQDSNGNKLDSDVVRIFTTMK